MHTWHGRVGAIVPRCKGNTNFIWVSDYDTQISRAGVRLDMDSLRSGRFLWWLDVAKDVLRWSLWGVGDLGLGSGWWVGNALSSTA
jgi:hypothetical protein